MASERTPLITTVRVGPPRRRYPHNAVRRFCTVALSSILLYFFLAFLVAALVFPRDHHHSHDGYWSWPGCDRRKVSYDQLKSILLDTPSSELAEEWSRYYTAGPHLAGKNYSQVTPQLRLLI